jgi:hypothetical protein
MSVWEAAETTTAQLYMLGMQGAYFIGGLSNVSVIDKMQDVAHT